MPAKNNGSLERAQLNKLSSLARQDKKEDYYKFLEQAGISYGSVALNVVKNEGLGATSRNFAEQVAKENNVQINWDSLSKKIMMGDIEARIKKFKESGTTLLSAKEIRDYHREAFRKEQIPEHAWIMEAMYRVIEEHSQENKDIRIQEVWNRIVEIGSSDQLTVIQGSLMGLVVYDITESGWKTEISSQFVKHGTAAWQIPLGDDINSEPANYLIKRTLTPENIVESIFGYNIFNTPKPINLHAEFPSLRT